MGLIPLTHGFATLNGTKRYFARKKVCDQKLRTTDGFYCLPIAVGTHLGEFSDEDSELYIEALTRAVDLGINFIDTAINYRGMRSEKDVGQALRLLIESGLVNRDQLIISTKAGQIFGDIHLDLRPLDYLEQVLIKRGILNRADVNIVGNHRHTLEPSFYKHSFEISRKNLGLGTIDIHYIHNPEISMNVLGRQEFYKRLGKLIEFYESKAEQGFLRYYGIATWWGLVSDEGSPWHISLADISKVVKSVAGNDNHFRFVQMPLSKSNNTAGEKVTQTIMGKKYSAIQAATELELYVTISSPLDQGHALSCDLGSVVELLDYVINTDGVLAAMVGSKKKEHVEENFRAIIR